MAILHTPLFRYLEDIDKLRLVFRRDIFVRAGEETVWRPGWRVVLSSPPGCRFVCKASHSNYLRPEKGSWQAALGRSGTLRGDKEV